MTRATPLLDVAEVRRVCLLLLDQVERRFGGRIDLTKLSVDYYWTIDLAAAFDMGTAPDAPVDCGQVSDDIAEISDLTPGKSEAIALWHDLDHLAGIMRLLAFLDLPKSHPAAGSRQPDHR